MIIEKKKRIHILKLYSIAFYIQYPVMNYNGKEYEKECIHLCD